LAIGNLFTTDDITPNVADRAGKIDPTALTNERLKDILLRVWVGLVRLFPLQLLEHEVRDRPGDSPKDRCREGTH
jgi:hypothetical protein